MADRQQSLTLREAQCLRALAHSADQHEAAEALGLTPRGLKFHLEAARRKLGATSSRQAARLLLLSEGVRPPEPVQKRQVAEKPVVDAALGPPPFVHVERDKHAPAHGDVDRVGNSSNGRRSLPDDGESRVAEAGWPSATGAVRPEAGGPVQPDHDLSAGDVAGAAGAGRRGWGGSNALSPIQKVGVSGTTLVASILTLALLFFCINSAAKLLPRYTAHDYPRMVDDHGNQQSTHDRPAARGG